MEIPEVGPNLKEVMVSFMQNFNKDSAYLAGSWREIMETLGYWEVIKTIPNFGPGDSVPDNVVFVLLNRQTGEMKKCEMDLKLLEGIPQ